MNGELRRLSQFDRGISKLSLARPNKALLRAAIPLRSIAAGELGRSMARGSRIDSDRSRGMLKLNGFVVEGRSVA